MKLLERNSCPLCNNSDIKLFQNGSINPETLTSDNFKITDNAYGSLWTFSKCHSCKFVFSNPYVSEDSIVEFYSHLEDAEYSEEAQGRSRNFHSILKNLDKIKKPDKSILDIGAASGIFLNIAKKEGYRISGIEPSEYLVSEANKKFNINLFNGIIEDYKSKEKYSVISLLDIIEHLVNPDQFIKNIDEFIKNEGILVIVTPDIDSITAKLFKRKWWHYRIAHINFFNLSSIQFLLKNNNYEIIKKKRYTWNFSLFYILTRIFPKLKNSKKLQVILKKINIKLQLFDSWEIYARKKNNSANIINNKANNSEKLNLIKKQSEKK